MRRFNLLLVTPTIEEEEEEIHSEALAPIKTKPKKKTKKKSRPKSIVRVYIKNIHCEHHTGQWLITHGQHTRRVKAAIISGVSFSCSDIGGGCGVGTTWRGWADGTINEKDITSTAGVKFTDEDKKGGRPIGFNRDEGKFFDPETDEEITNVRKLMLLPGCTALYWP